MATLDAYASVEDLRSDLGMTGTDRDPQLMRALNAARRSIDQHCHPGPGRQFKPGTAGTVMVVHPRVCSVVRCPDVHAITLVEHDPTDSGTWSTVATSLWRGRPGPDRSGWPTTAIEARNGHAWTGPVRITGTPGWPAIPADVETANLILAGRLWKRPASPEGVVSGDFGVVRISRTDPDVAKLLDPYVIPVVG